MFEFYNTSIDDREKVCNILEKHECGTLEYNFTTFFIWQKIYDIKIAVEDEMLFSRTGRDRISFLFPVADDIEKALSKLEGYCVAEKIPMNFHCLVKSQKEILEKIYPDRYNFKETRDSGDYIYKAESLINLKGKKLSSKRNHINRFIQNNPDWRYESITGENISDAVEMHKIWCKKTEEKEKAGLYEESIAVKEAFRYYEELKLSGGILYVGNEAVAFSVGDRLNDNTFLVHIEKAFADIQGAYPMINKQFVINNCSEYEFVNREDDTGDEGLRKAKLSYQPYEIIEKFNAFVK